jgi:hypothetical protein
VGLMATLEASLTERRARCHRTRGDAEALLCQVRGLALWDLS